MANTRFIGSIELGFQGSQMNWIDNNGLFLVSNNSLFGLGFTTTKDVTLFLLVIMHLKTTKVIWAANRDFPVSNLDQFVFEKNGNLLLHKGPSVVWTTNSGGTGNMMSGLALQDSGDWVLQRGDGKVILMCRCIRIMPYPYCVSVPMLHSPQPYWSMGKDDRRNIDKNGGELAFASIDGNSLRFFDESKVLLWQFSISDLVDVNVNATWIAVLGSGGLIRFFNLNAKGSSGTFDPCGTPKAPVW
ncbi:G-type lectin S-receptor-like serine/threonine-protein kinase SD2-5 [Gossypium australe]|uniref:G-type lectin S-receptor-like serine/threonine-protein kinase SD2-5 n=1 Tax=Gossypium australe TaxID=47621 RepID=A0A5B6W7I6_9ROSI|nr:G-type lectin S-receptor-like serine/threonine-protein kinase SD2-5 [Gossypium australe]